MDGYLKPREVTGKVWSKLAEKYRFVLGKEDAFGFQKTCGQAMSLSLGLKKRELYSKTAKRIYGGQRV